MKKLLALTIFLGSFLSFALEPMIGRTLLPVFGGTPSVWVTCLAAFQVLMVGGYFYAGKVKTCRVHVSLLVLAAAWCAAVALFRKPLLAALSSCPLIPAFDVLLCVLVLSGVTFILLSANSSVVQILSGGDYRLYAVSNAGSLIGLLAYPLVFEPNLALTVQWYALGAGIVVYAALLWKASRSAGGAKDARPETEDWASAYRTVEQSPNRTILYLLLPAISCALLNAVTSHLTLDVAPMPLLWAILLALFLVSYIIGFSGRGNLFVWAILAAISAVGASSFGRSATAGLAFVGQLTAGCGLILFGCTFIHTYLYRIRPEASRLPRYYLYNVIGGAVGGVLTSIVAPLSFDTVAEYPIAIALLAVTVIALSLKMKTRTFLIPACIMLAAPVLLCVNLSPNAPNRTLIHSSRGFFGTVEVYEMKARTGDGKEGAVHEFVHGNTVHGIQARIGDKKRMPTCYFTPFSCGYAIAAHPNWKSGKPMRVNLVGLGIGVMFAYGREGDYYRAYEISDDALYCATNAALFSFIADCPAKTDIVLEDARKGLEAELAAGVEPYDVIVVDAFTGDNIPYHLSSIEAFELYFKLLKPDGILCVNISNWHLALEPYIKALGDHFDCPVVGMRSSNDFGRFGFAATTAFFCRDPSNMMPPPVESGFVRLIDFRKVPAMRDLPTDEKGSFVSLIRW